MANNNFKPAIKSLLLNHTALMIGQILVLSTFYIVKKWGYFATNPTETVERVLQLVCCIIAIAACIAAFVILNNAVKKLQQITSVEEKLNAYAKVSYQKFVLLEVAVMVAGIGFFLSNKIAFLGLAGILFLIFIAQRPTTPMITYHLQVTEQDIKE